MSTFLIYVTVVIAIVLRIAVINESSIEYADVQKSARLFNVGSTRGMIYDRNMIPLVNREFHTVLTVNPTEKAMSVLKESLTEEDYKNAVIKAENGKPFLIQCDYYNGVCDDIIASVTYERYSASDVATHLIGYLDYEGNGVSGTEKAFNSLLAKHSGNFSVRYYADAVGKSLAGMKLESIDNNYASVGGVVLTIDFDIQRICEDAMKRNSLDKGAVVVLDAENSEILALASAPEYDREKMSEALENDNQPFFNRAIAAYPVGSVFKPIVAAAAIETGAQSDLFFNCDGAVEVSGVKFNCHNRTGHGVLDMTKAMSVSCNAYFIGLGLDTGKKSVISLAENLGFGSQTDLCDGIAAAKGNLPSVIDIDSSAALANLSFGQGELLATPLQIAAAYSAFANGGYYNEPYLQKFIVGSDGRIEAYYKNDESRKVLTESVCNKIMQMLRYTVEDGSGKLAAPMNGIAYGKTATAETGQYKDGKKTVHTWFAGVYEKDEEKYVIVVFRENGDSSSTDCAPVFRDIADALS